MDPSQPLSVVEAWVRSTCAAQDIPERISDPAVLGEVATLLLPGRRWSHRHRHRHRQNATGRCALDASLARACQGRARGARAGEQEGP